VGVVTAPREQRKRAELLAKLRSVTAELDLWLADSGAGRRVEKHHSQVRRVVAQLRPLADRVEQSIEGGDVSSRWLALEEEVLDLHRVWGFFREKLALRRLDELAGYLVLADELSWACYEPAQRAAVAAGAVRLEEVREPPLVYLSAAASPFSVARGESYAHDVDANGLTTRTARALVARLPVPVIGVPWFQLQHLPDALVIGHEVGHVVLAEMVGLDAVAELVRAAVGADVPAGEEARRWDDWAEEAFADVYGALCGGGAYVTVLTDFLSLEGVDRAPANPSYPPATSRLRLAEEALHEAARRRTPTPGDAATGAASDELDPAPERAVARALVAGPYACFGGKRLDEVIAPAHQGGDGPKELLQNWAPQTRDIRTLMAVTVRAFADDPDGYERSKAQERVLDRARKIQQPGTRYRAGGEGGNATAISQADAQRVDDLYALLTQHPPP
jgi:hypothetical protein